MSPSIHRLTYYLKEDDPNFRKVTMKTIKEIVEKYTLDDINSQTEELLVDACLFAFH